MTEKTTLADLLTLQLHMYEEKVHDTVTKAVKELAIEKVSILQFFLVIACQLHVCFNKRDVQQNYLMIFFLSDIK